LAPRTIRDVGIDPGLLGSLALKVLYFSGNSTASDIAARMALPLGTTLEILDFLRKERLCEVLGSDSQALGSYRHSLTMAGLDRTAAILAQSGYAGPTPVPLRDYVEMVKRQSVRDVRIDRRQIESCLAPLVLEQRIVDLIGQAMTSERAVLFYGESGNGKTTAAECLSRTLPGEIRIPYAIEVMHQIIRVYDPAVHQRTDQDDIDPAPGNPADLRWVRIKRPFVTAAGELAASHLELILDDTNMTYEAPIQMKANGGLLVIDDFGRQRLDAAYLLNRWIVPLEQGKDSLSLNNGARFQVPFDVVPMFLTNKHPAELADDAFLRRIRYKVEVPTPTVETFTEILRRQCARHNVAYDDASAAFLLEEYFRKPGRQMRGCHPRDLVESIVDAANYAGTAPVLRPETIAQAAHGYFVEDPAPR
jgi:predicted ATPase with chaperone activity